MKSIKVLEPGKVILSCKSANQFKVKITHSALGKQSMSTLFKMLEKPSLAKRYG